MCGISGIALKPGERADPAALRAMATAMRHRGPDADGVFTDGPYGLSHRRLKIIDLSAAAAQPFTSGDGRVTLVFNGEIYNFRALRSELEALGRRFRSASDTEVLLQAYEVWGTASFARLNGMFAFALLDRRESEPILHLVRDRFGIKPLFYAALGGRIAFASEIKPLLAVDWISREIDPDSVFYFLKFSHVPQPKSIFRSIQQLEPGTFLTFSRGDVSRKRYYDAITFSRPETADRGTAAEPKSESEWLRELDRTLDGVVARQIESDVPVGCFLSGGIDSSLLAQSHARQRSSPIDTFTIRYHEAEFDESIYAAEVSRAIGSRHHEILVSPRDLIALVDEVPEHFDQPLADPTLLPTLILSRETRRHVTVALSGDGGDELFFGYPYQRALRRLEPFTRLPEPVRRSIVATARPLGRTLGRKRAHQFDKLLDILSFRENSELFQYFIGTIGPMRLDRLSLLLQNGGSLRSAPFTAAYPELNGLSWRGKIDQLFLRTFLPDTVLAKGDRASMAFGLETRVPFLDDELVAFAARLPFDLKWRAGRSKYLLRRLLAEKIPGTLANRRKQGFSIPMRDWLRGELRPWMERHLEPTLLERGGIFRGAEVARLMSEHTSGRANHSHLLYSLITFQMWKERYCP